jgi:DNA-binding CsgD family transcriptional regulator
VNQLLGRSTDLEVVGEFLARAAASGGALVIVGDPGVGKTMLLDHLADALAPATGLTLRATGAEFESDVAYAGLSQLVLPVADRVRLLADVHATALETVLGLRYSSPPARPVVVNAVAMLLRSLAVARPVLLIVDDLQWLDRATAAVLSALARRLKGSPVAMVGSIRPGEEGFFERAGLEQHHLLPLSDEAAQALLASRYPALSAAVRSQVIASAQGNPLALVELPPALGNSPERKTGLSAGVIPLSRRLQAAFADRLAAFEPVTRHALLLAALEPTGSTAVLRAAVGEDLLEILAPAEQARLVMFDEIQFRLSFRHPLTRAAVVGDATAAQRRQAHADLAAVTVDDPDRRAWHLARAALGPDENAAAALETTGHRLLRRGDTIGAVAALSQAAALSPARPEHARRLADAAYAGARLAGGFAVAGDLLSQAREADPDGSGSVEHAIATAFVLLNADGDVGTAHRIISGALENADDHALTPTQLRAALSTFMYVCHFGARPELWAPFDAVLARFGPQISPLIHVARWTYPDGPHASRATYEQLDKLVAGIDQEEDPGEVILYGLACIFVDRLGGLRGAMRKVLEQSRAANDINGICNAEQLIAWDDFYTGRWEEAERSLSVALDRAREHEYRLLAWPAQYGLALLAGARGDSRLASEITDDLLRWAVPRGVDIVRHLCSHALAVSAAGQQDWETAFREASAISPPGRFLPHRTMALRVVLELVEAAVRTGRLEQARAHVTAARAAGIAAISGRTALTVGAAEALAADDDKAPGHYEAALATPDAHAWPFERARVQLLYGQALRRARATTSARRHLDDALREFDRLGAAPWAAMARAELRAAGIATTVPARPGDLTAQERMIAEMAAEGMTNKQIAARLVMSHRTVGAHLYRIFPKLGITSRAGLRDALTQQQTRNG